MTLIEFFKQQFMEEGETTRKMLSRVPEDKWEYAPHPKSMKMKALTTHIADLPGWIHLVFTTDFLDFADPYEQPQIHSTADLMAYFEKRYADGLRHWCPKMKRCWTNPGPCETAKRFTAAIQK